MSLCRGRVRDTQFPCGVCVAHSVHALGNASDSHAQTVSCLFPSWKSLFYFLLLLIWPLLAILRRPRRNILLLWASHALSFFGCARSQQRVVCSPGINIYISTHMGAEAQSVHVCDVHAWRTHTQGRRANVLPRSGHITNYIAHFCADLHYTRMGVLLLSVRSPTACNKHQAIEIFLSPRTRHMRKIHFMDSRIFQAKSLVKLLLGQTDTRKQQRRDAQRARVTVEITLVRI
jgi:hypothetical protein